MMTTIEIERRNIERKIDMMSEEELKKWCKDNLHFEDDYNINFWAINADDLSIDRGNKR